VAIAHAAPVLESENSIVAPVPEPEKEKLNCAIKYLKGVNQLDANFPEYPATGNAIDVCENYLKDSIAESYDSTASRLRKDDEMRPYMDCTMGKLRADEWSDLFLKRAVYKSAVDLNIENRQAKVDELKQALIEKTADTLKNCIYEKKFGKIFDKMIKNDSSSSSSSDEDDLETDYCARKHVTDNNFIDPSYNLVLNPKNIDVTVVNCTPILQKAINKFEQILIKDYREEGLSEAKIDCIVEIHRQEHVTEQFLRSYLVKEIEITDEQKATERTNFVKLMTNLSTRASLLLCK